MRGVLGQQKTLLCPATRIFTALITFICFYPAQFKPGDEIMFLTFPTWQYGTAAEYTVLREWNGMCGVSLSRRL